MLHISTYPRQEQWEQLIKRPTITTTDYTILVDDIFLNVKLNGDKAVTEYNTIFDGYKSSELLVTEAEFLYAEHQVTPQLKSAIALAKNNITHFHRSQEVIRKKVTPVSGVTCWQETRPIEKVGLYIPGGTAPLFSTVLMLAIPAKLAGCKEVVICTPPDSSGVIDSSILYAAQICGIHKVVKVGGIQAIAAMTFGTLTIPKVYKIFGPGNRFVTAAKSAAIKYGVAIDLPAGPSELMVIADDSSDARFVAADLLSQAEHGIDSQVLLVTDSPNLLVSVEYAIEKQIRELPRRAIVEQVLKNSQAILVKQLKTALDIANHYAPEHLVLVTKSNTYFAEGIQNAGSVFIGNYTPESAGDYASGTNHTLPTNGYSKQYSGVTLDSFTKTVTFQEISKKGLTAIGPAVETMATHEGLTGHKNAIRIRLTPNSI